MPYSSATSPMVKGRSLLVSLSERSSRASCELNRSLDPLTAPTSGPLSGKPALWCDALPAMSTPYLVNLRFINLLQLRSHTFSFIENNASVTVTVTGTFARCHRTICRRQPGAVTARLNGFLPYSSTFSVKTENAPSASRVLRASARINDLLRR
jgi:hypothetical protein